MRLVFDIEANGFRPTIIWCICAEDVDTGKRYTWRFDEDPCFTEFKKLAPSVTRWIAHNGLGYDVPWVNQLLGYTIDPQLVVDTFVVSRLTNYPGYRTHSLDEIGQSIGFPKTDYTGGWDMISDEMVSYCEDDVTVNVALYKRLFAKVVDMPEWQSSLRCEHNMAIICHDLHMQGFHFNRELAETTLAQLNERVQEVEAEFNRIWPPELREVGRIKYRVRMDGQLYGNVQAAIDNRPKTERDGEELVLYDWHTFKPGSSKQRVERLWEAGWEPTEKTDAHYKFEIKARIGRPWGETNTILTHELYKQKKEYFDFYGWKVSDENLETLPDDAPEGAQALAEWLTLNGRIKAVEERLRECEEDSRIRTNFWHIGSWTHRMAHSSPNLANISSPWNPKKEPRNAVQRVKAAHDANMRVMFDVDEGYLVGTDAESIQLRILAHYLRNEEYVHAIVTGRKEDATDIHNVNRRALALDHLTRDHSKTFIYAWLLGAGVGKVSRILECGKAAAKGAVDAFVENTDGLGELKRGRICRDARRGYFVGLDGRKVVQDQEYYMLAGYLQNGEATIMKHANWLWRQWADEAKIRYKQVNFVHDEWQTQVLDSMDAAEQLGQLQCRSLTVVGEQLNCFCPMSGETRIGANWLETH